MATLSEQTLTAWNFHWAGDHARAEKICHDVLAEDARNANAWYLLATLAYRAGRIESAIEQFQRADAIEPDRADLSNDFGVVLLAAGRFDEAVPFLAKAVVAQPDNPQVCVNLANALRDQGRFNEALLYLQHAIEIQPDNAEAHWDRALTWLLAGDYERGWPEFEWRFRLAGFEDFPNVGVPRWDGSALAGRTILVFAEQGVGDTLQMARYAAVMKSGGARVVVGCRPTLAKLLANVVGVDEVLTQGSVLPRLDFWAPLMSLPGICNTTRATIPAEVPYLRAAPELVDFWRRELEDCTAGAGGFRIGIAWHGRPQYRDDRFRSFSLEMLAPLARVAKVSLVSLQKGPGVEELADVTFSVIDFGSRLDETSGPFMDTAALMQNLDLVVAPNTGLAHLAGAAGVRTWLALSVYPDWRWSESGDNSRWYPTLRLFRQEKPGEWSPVFERMAGELAAELEKSPRI
jgi:hypothetical protein